MGSHILEGNPPIDVTLRNSARAKRMTLRVSRLDGRVTLTLPPRTPQREGLAFLRSKEPWLRGHLAQLRPVASAEVGSEVIFRGQNFPVVAGPRARAAIGTDAIEVSSRKPAGPQIKALFRHHARDALAAASDRYADAVGREYTGLSIRDTRSRWGSCSAQGVLMYSWRLIMAPPAVLDYVAAHEVAHLVEMNHQPAFWNVVAGICPDYQTHRAWLRKHGDTLHRVTFDN